MQYLAAIGLFFDLIGVVILGVDLVLAQWGEQNRARRRLPFFKEALRKCENAVDVGANLGKKMGFSESRPVMRFEDLTDVLIGLETEAEASRLARQNFTKIAVEVVGQQELQARRSLLWSYVGLSLILLGFALQLAAGISGLKNG